MDDEYTYLQPEFDPSTLTVPRLRSILVAHNVGYPSSAKKPDLIALFNDNVAPQARKILSVQSRTKRSARGIVDVPSSQESAAGDEIDDYPSEAVPAVTPARRSTRRTTRTLSEDVVEPTPRSRRSVAPPSTVKRTPSTKHARVEDDGDMVEPRQDVKRPATTKARQSVPPPVESSSESDEPTYRHGTESAFSKDNPFQSGSSPPSGYRSKSTERRRTTMGVSADAERRKSRDGRRRTDGFGAVRQDDGIVVPSSSTFDMSVARVRAEADQSTDNINAGEEFMPDENVDLVKAQEKGRTTVARGPRKQPKSAVAKAAPWSVLLVMLVAVAGVWRQEKLQVGYCGVGEESTALAGVEVPEWASFVRPQCEPCPQHAYCYSDLKTVCEPDFILTPHPLSFYGLVPLPPTCEPDSEKVRKIKTVADFAVEKELRTRNAQYECGEAPTPDMSETELKQTVSAKRSRRMSDEEFDDLWGAAIGEIAGREEVTSKVEGKDDIRTFRSTSLAQISLSCAVRRSLRLALRQHLPKLVALILISLSAVYGRHALKTRRSTSVQAKKLAGQALEKLALQASLYVEDPAGYPEPWISMVALRDDVLREEFRAKERTRLWEVVKSLVEGNANVRTMVREGRTGEVSRVWEWVGALQRIEGVARRQSGAVGRLAGSPGRLIDVKEEGEVNERSLVEGQQKWEEGRSYY